MVVWVQLGLIMLDMQVVVAVVLYQLLFTRVVVTVMVAAMLAVLVDFNQDYLMDNQVRKTKVVAAVADQAVLQQVLEAMAVKV